MSDTDYDEQVECEGQTALDLPDAGPVDESCSLCMGGGSCPQCSGSGTTGEWDEERFAQDRRRVTAMETAVRELRRIASNYGSGSRAAEGCRVIANDLERAIGVPW